MSARSCRQCPVARPGSVAFGRPGGSRRCSRIGDAETYFATGEVPEPLGSAHRLLAPYQALAASDGYFTIGAGAQNLWERFCRVVGLESLLDEPAYATPLQRRMHQARLERDVEALTRRRPRSYWLETLGSAGIPCGPINRIDEVFADPHTAARDLVVSISAGEAGTVRTLGTPLKMSGTPPRIRGGVPELDEHRRVLLPTADEGPS